MIEMLSGPEPINFGDLPPAIDELLQQAVQTYRRDRDQADRLFRAALALGPEQLAIYYCLYKIHTYQGHLDAALAIAGQGLAEAARQAGWPAAWQAWPVCDPIPDGPGRFALYTLKALAFIHLRRQENDTARAVLGHLAVLDPTGSVGWPVIAALADGVAG